MIVVLLVIVFVLILAVVVIVAFVVATFLLVWVIGISVVVASVESISSVQKSRAIPPTIHRNTHQLLEDAAGDVHDRHSRRRAHRSSPDCDHPDSRNPCFPLGGDRSPDRNDHPLEDSPT